MPPRWSTLPRWRPALGGALLFAVVALVFLPSLRDGFITYDDPVYVTQNPHVKAGLTAAGLAWALRSTEASNWHPLTWLSHMADVQLFGLEPWGHHLTSVLLHAFCAALLFAVLRRLTGSTGRSLLVAALFGLHPLHVESVAWISERKDVLSAACGMLVLWCYAHWAEARQARLAGAGAYYSLALLFLALGLLAKQMLVTLPCVLLLLDFWPLGRWKPASVRGRLGLVAEKLPFLALAAAAAGAALLAQGRGGAVQSVADFPLGLRAENALVTYCRYLGRCFWPTNLAVFYPDFGEAPPRWQWMAAAGFLIVVTAAAFLGRRRRPYLLVGWLWYLGTLVPVIGLVQVGGQSMADRYTYIPLIGIFIMAVWAAADVAAGWRLRPWARPAVATVAVGACLVVTCRQLSYWRDGATLFRHAAAVTTGNWVAHTNLGATLARLDPAASAAEFREAVRIISDVAEVHDRRGLALLRAPGQGAAAIAEFRRAEEIMPDLPAPHFHLATALGATPAGRTAAVAELRTVVRLDPDSAAAHFNLGYFLSASPAERDAAIAEYESAIRLQPGLYQARANLGALLAGIPGRRDDAVAQLREALAINPGLAEVRSLLGRLQAAP